LTLPLEYVRIGWRLTFCSLQQQGSSLIPKLQKPHSDMMLQDPKSRLQLESEIKEPLQYKTFFLFCSSKKKRKKKSSQYMQINSDGPSIPSYLFFLDHCTSAALKLSSWWLANNTHCFLVFDHTNNTFPFSKIDWFYWSSLLLFCLLKSLKGYCSPQWTPSLRLLKQNWIQCLHLLSDWQVINLLQPRRR
jgi:hypothetical protein